MDKSMWERYQVEMRFEDRLMGGVPKHSNVIKSWLEARMPTHAPPDATPLNELADQVAVAVQATEDAENKVWTGFMGETERGLYIPGFHLKAHLKDVANIAKAFLGEKNLKAKLADRLFVDDKEIWLGVKEPAGYWEHAVHIMTPQGPRSALKRTDYVVTPTLCATIRVFADGVITESLLQSLFEFGGTKGFGAERGLGNGRYQAKLSLIVVEGA